MSDTPKHPRFNDAIDYLKDKEFTSTKSLKTIFNIGDNSVGRLIDELEEAHIIGPFEGSKLRKVLINILNQ